MNRKDQNNISKLYTEAVQGNFKPVTADYIYFDDEGELYQVDPYELLAGGIQNNEDQGAVLYNKLKQRGVRWKEARIAASDDVRELVPGAYNQVSSEGRWVQVDNSFPGDHSFIVKLGYK